MSPSFKRALILAGTALIAVSTYAEKKKKVLYFTHEPGRWHKYTPQKEIFKKIADKAGWDLTVSTGEHEPQIKYLRTPDFGKGYDAIVYNFCFAKSVDLDAEVNLMNQTRVNGVPAMLIHCAMHSWWATYKQGKEIPGYKGKAKADPKVIEAWQKANGNDFWPAWGDFTGIASTRHGPKKPIKISKVTDHPATKRFPKDGYTTGNTELYNNVYKLDEVVSLVAGEQGNSKASVMWICPQGKSKVIGFSLGHGVDDWSNEHFQNLIIDGVNYLAENPGN